MPRRLLRLALPGGLTHNIQMHLGDGILFVLAMNFASVQTILPVFFNQLGATPVLIGAIPVLWTLGLNLPQLFYVRRHNPAIVRPTVLRYGLAHRLTFLLLALAALLPTGANGSVLTYLLLLIIFAGAVAGSLAIPAWYELFSKTVPYNHRGRVLAVRQLIGSGLAIGSGYIINRALALLPFPGNYGLLFLICFALIMASYIFLYRVRESEGGGEAPQEAPPARGSRALLRENKNFRMYVAADALLQMALTANGFYAVYAINRFGLPDASAGVFTLIITASMTAGNLLFGMLADLKGHRVNMIILAASSLLASAGSIVAISAGMYYLVFIPAAFSMCILGISRIPFVIELAHEHERMMYVSTLNSVTAVLVFYGLLSGAIITAAGYTTLFAIDTLLAGAALLLLLNAVKDPRQLTTNEARQ